MSSTSSVVHDLTSKSTNKSIVLAVILGAAILGVASGFFVSNSSSSSPSRGEAIVDGEKLQKGDIVGSDDTETYRDEAEGVLKEGGIEGEGAYHLEREGGETQYVYLTSAIVDLSQFIDRRVRVWGETHASNVAPWLMEVGRLELLE